jgi:hypothetical protein
LKIHKFLVSSVWFGMKNLVSGGARRREDSQQKVGYG